MPAFHRPVRAGRLCRDVAAAPHVAGAAALLGEAYPAYSVDQLRHALEVSALDLGAAGPDTVYGRGRRFLGDPQQEPATPTPTIGPTLTPSPVPTPTPGAYDWRRVALAGRTVRDIGFHPRDAESAIVSTAGDDLGLLVTHDGGQTWTQANHGLGDWDVWRLASAPDTPWTLYAAGVAGLWRSGDGGRRWDAVTLPRSPVSRLSALGISAVPPARLYLTAWEACRMTFASGDGGRTWQEYQGPRCAATCPWIAPSWRHRGTPRCLPGPRARSPRGLSLGRWWTDVAPPKRSARQGERSGHRLTGRRTSTPPPGGGASTRRWKGGRRGTRRAWACRPPEPTPT